MSSNVARFLSMAAAARGDADAVLLPSGTTRSGDIAYRHVGFAELDALAGRAATLMARKGFRRGDRVLVMVRPGLELILLVFALFRSGLVPVVIDPGMGLKSFRACVRRTRPDHVAGIPLAIGISHLFRGDFASVRGRLMVGGGFLRELERGGLESMPTVDCDAGETAALLFTSGSTGMPKGVRYEHGMLQAQLDLVRDTYGIQPGEIDLPMLPVFALFNPALGMTSVIPEMNPSKPATADPARIVQAILQNQVTNSFGSPALWKKVARHCLDKGIRLPSLKRILMAGAPVPPSLIRDFRERILVGGEVHTPYGATECLPIATISGREILTSTEARTHAGEGICVGRTIAPNEIRVVPISDAPLPALPEALPAGEIGEIVVSGPVVTREYDALPAENALAKVPGPDGRLWHRIGDTGWFDAEGRLWFCGRKAERVVAPGGTLFTARIEEIFNAHPRVFRTALLGMGPRGTQRPVLAVEPEPGHWPSTKAARLAFERELALMAAAHPGTRTITTFAFVRHFPVDVRHNAKIHRLTLARRLKDACGE